jgi:ABC-type molybdate transport system ATPase subunit
MSNFITATVSNIKNIKNLYEIELNFHNRKIILINLELNENIKINSKLKLTIPSSTIFLIKELNQDSYNSINVLDATILDIKFGEILSTIDTKIFDTKIDVILSSKILEKLDIKIGDRVWLILRETQIDIVEVFND